MNNSSNPPQEIPEHAVAICANCKKIRAEDNQWADIEKVFDHLIFSHGICPSCCEKLYPGINLNETEDIEDDPGEILF